MVRIVSKHFVKYDNDNNVYSTIFRILKSEEYIKNQQSRVIYFVKNDLNAEIDSSIFFKYLTNFYMDL